MVGILSNFQSVADETFVERPFTRMAERRMTEVMGERECLGEVFVEPESARNRARDLGDFESMGEPGAVMIAFVKHEHLGLVGQPPERRRVDDAVAVAPVGAARAARRLGMAAPAARVRIGRKGGAGTGRLDRHESLAAYVARR